MSEHSILICGAGVAGLAAALSLHRHGISNISVIDVAAAPSRSGLGLNILPSAVRHLSALGVLDELREIAIETSSLAYFTPDGQHIWTEPRGRSAGYAWPQLSIHRVDLTDVLYRAAIERLGPDVVRYGLRLQSWCQDTSGHVKAQLVDVATGRSWWETARMLLGADGINSAVRQGMYPDEGQPLTNGMLMWRGTSWRTPFLDGSSMIVSGTRDSRLVLYPVRRATDGTVLINWVAATQTESIDQFQRGDWSRSADVQRINCHMRLWSFPWLDIPEIIASTSSIYEYLMVDRPPLKSWTRDLVTLLGDAAHPMYPMGSNGATQSIIDAAVLAQLLAGNNARSALLEYEQLRLPATAKVQNSNRTMGPEAMFRIIAERAPAGFRDLTDVLSIEELEQISRNYSRIAGFDLETVNSTGGLHHE